MKAASSVTKSGRGVAVEQLNPPTMLSKSKAEASGRFIVTLAFIIH